MRGRSRRGCRSWSPRPLESGLGTGGSVTPARGKRSLCITTTCLPCPWGQGAGRGGTCLECRMPVGRGGFCPGRSGYW
eukprot:55738-Rhodomonas_salina.5